MRKMMLALLAAGALFAFGCGEQKAETNAATDDNLKIGFGGALLGNLAAYGNSGYYGLEHVVLKTNAEGGLLGKQIEIVKEDDGCDPALASSAASKLLGEGVTLVLGHTCSGATLSALSAYGNKVLLISPSATDVSITDSGKNPYFFRTIMRDDAQADLQVEFVKKRGFKKVAIVHDKGEYGKALAERAKELLEADPNSGVEIVLFEGITTGQVSYDALVSKLKSAEADVLLWGGYYSDGSKLVTQMRAKDVPTIVVGADGLKNEEFIKIAGDAAEGVFVTGPLELTSAVHKSPAIEAALADHAKRYTEDVGPYFFYSIAATEALFDAITKVGNTTDIEAIKKQLQENTVETIMGPISFNEKGDLEGAAASMYEVKGGKFVEVTLAE